MGSQQGGRGRTGFLDPSAARAVLGNSTVAGLPLSEAWEKQVREWVRCDQGGETAPTGSHDIGEEGRGGKKGPAEEAQESWALSFSRLGLSPWPAWETLADTGPPYITVQKEERVFP